MVKKRPRWMIEYQRKKIPTAKTITPTGMHHDGRAAPGQSDWACRLSQMHTKITSQSTCNELASLEAVFSFECRVQARINSETKYPKPKIADSPILISR